MPWWTLLACADPPAAGPRCPELDFAVLLDSSLPDRFSHVVPLPDGDVVLAGYYGGDPAVAPGGPPLAFGYGARDGFVARVSPDGEVRWQHGFGGSGVDQVTALAPVAGQLWVAALFEGLEVQLDRETVPDTSGVLVDTDGGWLQFDLQTGELRRLVRMAQPSAQYTNGITGDADGNTYVVGHFTGPQLTVGPWTHDNPSEDGSTFEDQAFLASYAPDGTPRWLTTWGGVSVDEPEGLAWLGDHLVVGGTWLPNPVEVLSSDGTPHPLTPGVLDLLSFDPENGHPSAGAFATTGFATGTAYEIEQRPGGGLVLTGLTEVGTPWTTADGTTHTIQPQPSGNPRPAFRAVLDASGDITRVWSDDPLLFGSSATSDPVAVAGWAIGDLHDPDGSVVFDPPTHLSGYDGMAATFDADDHLSCAWLFAGDSDESALDAAFDARGGLWIVGEFIGDVLVTNSDGATVAEWTTDDNIDGFVMRFRGAADR